MTIEHGGIHPTPIETRPLAIVTVAECFDFLVTKAEKVKSDPHNISSPVSIHYHIDPETGTQTVMVAKWGTARIDSITAITKERTYLLEDENGNDEAIRTFRNDFTVSHDDYTRPHNPDQTHDYEMAGISGLTLFPEIEPPTSATVVIRDLLETK